MPENLGNYDAWKGENPPYLGPCPVMERAEDELMLNVRNAISALLDAQMNYEVTAQDYETPDRVTDLFDDVSGFVRNYGTPEQKSIVGMI